MADPLPLDVLTRVINIQWGDDEPVFGGFTVIITQAVTPPATAGAPPPGSTTLVFANYAENLVPQPAEIFLSEGVIVGAPTANISPSSVSFGAWEVGGCEWSDYSVATGNPIVSATGASVTVSVVNRAHYIFGQSFEWILGVQYGDAGEYYPVSGAPVVGAFTLDWSHVRADRGGGRIMRPVGYRVETGPPDDGPATNPFDAPALVLALSVSIFWEDDD